MIQSDPIPGDERNIPTQEIRERLNVLMNTDDEVLYMEERDIPFDNAFQETYSVREVQLDRDDTLDATFITLLGPHEPNVYASEDRYLLSDDNKLIFEHIHVHYTYAEAAARYDYEKALEDWKHYVLSLFQEGLLDELHELMAMDRIVVQYTSARDNHSRVMRELAWESDDGKINPDMLYSAQAVYSDALNACAEMIADHLLETTQHMNESNRYFYTELFKRVLAKFNSRYDNEMTAAMRFVEASQDANLRLEEGLSPEVDEVRAWRLLTVLDACE